MKVTEGEWNLVQSRTDGINVQKWVNEQMRARAEGKEIAQFIVFRG
jgi:hypothetical protein